MKQIATVILFLSIIQSVFSINSSDTLKVGDKFELAFSHFNEKEIAKKNTLEPFNSTHAQDTSNMESFYKKLIFRIEVLGTTPQTVNLKVDFERFYILAFNLAYYDSYYPELSIASGLKSENQFSLNLNLTPTDYQFVGETPAQSLGYAERQKFEDKDFGVVGESTHKRTIEYDEVVTLLKNFIAAWQTKGINMLPPTNGKINPSENYWEEFVSTKINTSLTGNKAENKQVKVVKSPGEISDGISFPGDTLYYHALHTNSGLNDDFYHLVNDDNWPHYKTFPKDDFLVWLSDQYQKRTKLLEQHKTSMSAKVAYEADLDIQYWAASIINRYNKKTRVQTGNFERVEIGRDEPFVSGILDQLKPQFDYVFHLENYEEYLSGEFYKSVKNYQASTPLAFWIRDYYWFARYSLDGYPRYFILHQTLLDLLKSKSLAEIQGEINDFRDNFNSPALSKSFEDVFEKIESIQPGAELGDLGLNFTKTDAFKKKNGIYKVIKLYDGQIGVPVLNSVIRDVTTYIKMMKAEDKFELFIFTSQEIKIPNEYKERGVEIKVVRLNEEFIEHDRRIFFDEQRNIQIIAPDNTIIIPFAEAYELPEYIRQILRSEESKPFSKADTRRLLLIVLTSLIGFGLLSWLIIRIRTKQIARREAVKRRLSEMEVRAIRSQMNPHFIFNSLNSIQNLVNSNKIEGANIYLSEFAEMMRLVLNNSEKQLVPLEEELQLITSYLDLEQLRTPFEYEIHIDESISPAEEEIPAMLLQPFVENAVVHGMAPQKGGFIEVALKKDASKIVCEITDDGMGISMRRAQRNGNGKAIKMVRERIKIVNSQSAEPLTLHIADRKETGGKGTLVKIEIPV
ncbi:Histidine kinase [Saccharicrinis carchari]|uniref:Histidine kinase n=1 Tax=Saccharicrinis carchari TaxID=1168039 RepID=A0A521AES4_SACCC|nr:histidine kinase [Saccharicrinis carchari]SMO33325.1 Histidine kinase [Saccharicrinis carchari]